MSRRRQARELVLGCLYARESTGQDPDAIFADQSVRQSYDTATREYARRVFACACDNADAIDRTIKAGSTRWNFDRIGSVEKNILRAAIAELKHCPETPAAVIIDEAIELAKAYAGEDSGSFVNGVLDWVYKHSEDSELPSPTDGRPFEPNEAD
ncbi:MAG TPA: transcription antitermination factor NusB [Acidobacteriota bacterium]|nr:transcription antitermination factor NusB [Acidobacteriota bacterium]